MCLIFAVGCGEDVDVADKQRTTIERFLTSSHVPRLINVVDVSNSLEMNPAFYERMDYSVYRYRFRKLRNTAAVGKFNQSVNC